MRRALAGALGFIAISLAAAAQPASDFLSNQTELESQKLHRLWRTQVPILKLRENIRMLAVRENLLFVGSDQGMLHCLDGETGALRWSASVSGSHGVVQPPVLSKDAVYVAAQNRLAQISREEGRYLWEESLPALATSAPATVENLIFVQTSDHCIYCMALKEDEYTKNEKWPFRRELVKRPIRWFYDAGGPMVNPPVLLPDRVIFATQGGAIYAAEILTGKMIYRFLTHSAMAAPLASLDRTLFVATKEYYIYAIDLINGEPKWKNIIGYPVLEQPVPFTDEVLIVVVGAGLMSLDAKTGATRWRNEAAASVVGVSKEHVYAMDGKRNMLSLDRKTGQKLGALPVGPFTILSDNQYTDRLYLSTTDGLVTCLAELDSEKPFLHPQAVAKLAIEKKVDKSKDAKKGFFDDAMEPEEKPKAEKKPAPKPKPKPNDTPAKPKKSKSGSAKKKRIP